MKSKRDIKKEFNSLYSDYLRLGKNLEEAIKTFLNEESIPYLNVYFRIKEFSSFFEKISRKNYSNPFEDIEDICGIRIICYYVTDIVKIEEVIKREFKLLEAENKSESLGLKEFAYRSTHNIIQIKNSWTATPNYRGLQSLKAEIQIRTVLMHAWAEVEHKLNYKSDAQVPASFQRKLFRLSAKFEEADEQFEELRNGINDYKKEIEERAKLENKFDVTQDFNRDSFVAFLNFHFPNSAPYDDNYYIDSSFEKYSLKEVPFKELEKVIATIKPYFKEISDDLLKSGYSNKVMEMPTEMLAFGMHALGKENYARTIASWKTVVTKWKKLLT